MTLSAVFFTTPLAVVTHESGRQYTANSSGLVTVGYADATNAGGIAAQLPLLYLTGTTADRATINPSATNPQTPPSRLAFDDTTLSAFVFYVGPALSSTSWVNSAGSQV